MVDVLHAGNGVIDHSESIGGGVGHNHTFGPILAATLSVGDDHLIHQHARANIDLNVLRTAGSISCVAEGTGVAIKTIAQSVSFVLGRHRIADGGHLDIVVEQLDLPEIDIAVLFTRN